MDDDREALIAIVLEWLKDAPPAPPESNRVPRIAGWEGKISICSGCAWRLEKIGRNFDDLADAPVWQEEWPWDSCFRCEVCWEASNG